METQNVSCPVQFDFLGGNFMLGKAENKIYLFRWNGTEYSTLLSLPAYGKLPTDRSIRTFAEDCIVKSCKLRAF